MHHISFRSLSLSYCPTTPELAFALQPQALPFPPMATPISLQAFQSPPATSCSDPILNPGHLLPAYRVAIGGLSLFRKSQYLPYHPLSHSPAHFPSPSRASEPGNLSCCHCHSSSSDSSPAPDDDAGGGEGDVRRWEFPLRQLIRSAAQKLDGFWNSRDGNDVAGAVEEKAKEDKEEERKIDIPLDVEDWDWERWQRHFKEVVEQERSISVLKSQLDSAIDKEDYEEAARIKVAIAAIATKDTVGSVISFLNRALEDERYQDAAHVHDNAGAGLVGWWAGVSDDKKDPYGCIIRISAEHGRYVARSFNPRQLGTSGGGGAPLFEIFLTLNKRGEYKQQAVYLRRKVASQSSSSVFPKSSTGLSTLNPSGSKDDIFDPVTDDPEDTEDDDDLDVDGLSGFHSILQDPAPDVKVKVVKVFVPGKVDQDSISKMVDELIEEEDEEKQIDFDISDVDDGVVSGTDKEKDEIDMGVGGEIIDMDEQNEIAMKVVVGGLLQKLSSRVSPKDLLRVPAKLNRKGRKTFSFAVEDDDDKRTSGGKGLSQRRKAKVRGQRSAHRVMLDLAKFINKGEKIPTKVLKDVGDLVSFTLSQSQNRQPLSGSTTFNRIELSGYPDPLNGIYIGAYGPYTSEVLQLRRKFGQWKDDLSTDGADLEFYEYVEAVKLTGDPYVPAGQIAFRAKVGKRYQLPHKGIIPEEFGVIARYRGEGRLAEPGYRNPRWVDGELVILDGKYIKSGPIVGFVYWAPESQFLVFFQRLRLQE